MKISSLLFTTALVVIASASYSADLPAKKAAPAATASDGCPAFGAGFFRIPGGDTCIKIAGYVRVDNGISAGTNSTNYMVGYANLKFDVRGNTEVGAIRSYIETNKTLTGFDYGYVDAGGFLAGKSDSITEIYMNGVTYGYGRSANPGGMLAYTLPVGTSSMTVSLEENEHGSSAGTQIRPDLNAKLITSAGPATLTLTATSSEPHVSQSQTGAAGQGYAFSGKAAVKAGDATISLYGAYAYGDLEYLGKTSTNDYDGTNYATGNLYAGELAYPVSTAGTLYLYGGQRNYTEAGSTLKTSTQFAVSYKQMVGSGLYVRPEFVQEATTSATTTNSVYLRIQRDF